jgi:hypothetical protein
MTLRFDMNIGKTMITKLSRKDKLCKKQINCVFCGIGFYPDVYSRKYCGPDCYRASQQRKKADDNEANTKLKCSRCHAMIGFGAIISGRLLKLNGGNLHAKWKSLGIVPQYPNGKRWYDVTAGLRPLKKTYSQQVINKLWMSEYNVKFPEWNASKYEMMTLEQRKAHNKKTHDSKKRRGYKKNAVYIRNWKKINKDKSNAYVRKSNKKRKLIDPGYKVQCNLRRRLRDVIKSAKKGGWTSHSNLTGCTSQELAAHIEKQFTKGMTWSNYGIDGWHVDHIMPCSKFDHTNELHVKQCWHYTNLRPLWANDNLAKSDTVTQPQLQLIL